MTLDSVLDTLADPTKRLAATELISLSDIAADPLARLTEAWPEIAPERRRRIISDLVDLAEDNVELNYDRIYKLALADESAGVRATAIRGLHEYEGRDLIPRLAGLLRDDPDTEVRREAAIALGRYALAAELGYLDANDVWQLRVALMEAAEDADQDERVRARAIEAMGPISDEETENLIESIYQEPSLWLKVGAVDAMGRSANEAWLPVVIQEMESAAPEMRHAAAFAAGEIGSEDAVQPLRRLAIMDQDREVQRAAIHALGEIGGARAKVALQAVLFEAEDDLREAVEEALSEIAFADNPLNPSL